VWLEPVGQASIETLRMTPNVDTASLLLVVAGRNASEDHVVEARVFDEGRQIASVRGRLGSQLVLPISQMKLWSPDHPFLYDLKISLTDHGRQVDAVDSYFGMRKFTLGKDERGITRLVLNGKPVFQVGPLDQGYWPDGLYTAPTDEALRFDIEVTTKLGFNMTRKHIKIEPERWYYWCDKLGLPVWQDMVSGENKTDDNKRQFEAGLKRAIEERGNHPCIIMWIVFNEGWGQFDTERLVKMVQDMDPSRLVSNATGGKDAKVGDIIDIQ
jgi:beta-galactosidase/beta-glucuronidase